MAKNVLHFNFPQKKIHGESSKKFKGNEKIKGPFA